MLILETNNDQVVVQLTKDELIILNNCLNEVCNALDLPEFNTRIGATWEQVQSLFTQINKAIGERRD